MGTMLEELLQIDENRAAEIVEDFFGIPCTCQKLVGYAELNFLVRATNGQKFLLKIPFEEVNLEEFDFHYKLFNHLAFKGLIGPKIIETLDGQLYANWFLNGKRHYARLISWLDGEILGNLERRPASICRSIGQLTAENTKALLDFEHSYAHREFSWDSDQAFWAKTQIYRFSGENRTVISYFIDLYEEQAEHISELPKSIIHNDINENNILFERFNFIPKAVKLIDYGDAIYTSRINNLAIALSYIFQSETDILSSTEHTLNAYASEIQVEDDEIRQLYLLIGIRLVISLTHANMAKEQFPDSEYHQSSVKGSWKALFSLFGCGIVQFTEFCMATVDRNSDLLESFSAMISANKRSIKDLFPTVDKFDLRSIDLGLESDLVPHEDDPYYEENFAINLRRIQDDHPSEFLVGGYGEIRDFYTTDSYMVESLEGTHQRSKHLGVDVWLDANTPISSLWDGVVKCLHHSQAHKDYGGLVILEHHVANCKFYTLYGHLSEKTIRGLKKGQQIRQGDIFAYLGEYEENGHWYPHLHFQIILDLLGNEYNFDGVVKPDHWKFMNKICPDPNMAFFEDFNSGKVVLRSELLKKRKEFLGYGLSVSYQEPLHIVRGKGVYLIDSSGQKYLDTVNNVAHVGHENYHVLSKAQRQMSKLNTNTRYLHKTVLDFAEKLAGTFPVDLKVVHFTNSGSEANELALRMVKTVTGRDDILAIEVGYHGNTQGTIAISSYKFDAEGGGGRPEKTHLLDLPDVIRGKYTGNRAESEKEYIKDAIKKIKNLHGSKVQLAGFIHESILSCGGQIVLPDGYLKAIYQEIRSQGGVVIADEVQVGFGRVGKHFWAFELQDVVPDIVVMGKPIGNGHPLGAVICTEKIATAFNNGMEYFNTFGGNPVSAITGMAVLEEIEKNNLQSNANEIGAYLKEQLALLQDDFPVIYDIRGEGLFLGIEFLDEELKPAAKFASHVVNAMRDRHILMSSDGPDYNVLKIKPPITFSRNHADYLLFHFREVLANSLPKNS